MKYRFLEVLNKIVGTNRGVKKEGNAYWWRYDYSDGILIDRDGDKVHWPCLEDQIAEIWEVEPEEIYVWGKCDIDGKSWIYTQIGCVLTTHTAVLEGTKNTFPNNEFQKYKLVPVEEKEY